MSYTFVRIRRKNSDDYGVWYLKPNSVQDIQDHWDTVCASQMRDTVRDRFEKAKFGDNGVLFPHPVTEFGIGVEAFCQATNRVYTVGLLEVENEAYRSRMSSFRKGHDIYLKEGMTVFSLDDRFFEVSETVVKDTLSYPTKRKWETEDVRYMQWNMLGNKGTHWYAKIGHRDVVDAQGHMKWDTRKEAEEAASWFLENKLNK